MLQGANSQNRAVTRKDPARTDQVFEDASRPDIIPLRQGVAVGTQIILQYRIIAEGCHEGANRIRRVWSAESPDVRVLHGITFVTLAQFVGHGYLTHTRAR